MRTGIAPSPRTRQCFLDYIGNPKAKIPETKKMFGGIKDEIEASNLWAYLRQFGPDGRPK